LILAAAPPDTALGEHTALPQVPYLDLREPTSKGREWMKEGTEEQGSWGRREGKGWTKGKGREGES